jgi:hypothetical protein
MIPTYTAKNKQKYRYYVCSNAQKTGFNNCPTRSVNANEIERAVIDCVKKIIAENNLTQANIINSTLWETLFPQEQRRILNLIISKIHAEDYLREIKTIVGLGFTAVLVDSSFLTIYYNKFNSFIQYMDFKKHTGALSVLSLNIAEMVDLSSYVFRIIQYPGYYKDFSIALRKALTRMGSQLAGKSEEAEKLLQIILQR